jgi:hypothetical protein
LKINALKKNIQKNVEITVISGWFQGKNSRILKQKVNIFVYLCTLASAYRHRNLTGWSLLTVFLLAFSLRMTHDWQSHAHAPDACQGVVTEDRGSCCLTECHDEKDGHCPICEAGFLKFYEKNALDYPDPVILPLGGFADELLPTNQQPSCNSTCCDGNYRRGPPPASAPCCKKS